MSPSSSLFPHLEESNGSIHHHKKFITVIVCLPFGILLATIAIADRTPSNPAGRLYAFPRLSLFQDGIPLVHTQRLLPSVHFVSHFPNSDQRLLSSPPLPNLEVPEELGKGLSRRRSFRKSVLALFAGCLALVVAIVCWPLNTLSRLWNALGRRMPGSPEETSMDTLAGALKEEGDEASYGSTSRDASDASLVNPGWIDYNWK
eukprot:EG_transcript_26204